MYRALLLESSDKEADGGEGLLTILSQFESSPLELVTSSPAVNAHKLSPLLLAAYTAISDRDAIYGCGQDCLTSNDGRYCVLPWVALLNNYTYS
jgi:hypothetical protein